MKAHPQGLTTAASIWAAAGIGLGAGFGKYLLAGGTTLILLFVLRVVEHFERRYLASRTRDNSRSGKVKRRAASRRFDDALSHRSAETLCS